MSEIRAKAAKIYCTTVWKNRGKGIKVCGDETTGAYFNGKEFGEIARGFKIGIGFSLTGVCARDIGFKMDSKFQDGDFAGAKNYKKVRAQRSVQDISNNGGRAREKTVW